MTNLQTLKACSPKLVPSGRSLVMVDVDSRVTSSQPHRGWMETSLCLCEGRGEARNFSRNSYAGPFPASRVFLSFSRQRRLSVDLPSRRAVSFDRIININPWEVIAQRRTQHTQRIRHTRSSSVSYSPSRPHSGIVCVCLLSTVVGRRRKISCNFPLKWPRRSLAHSRTCSPSS